MCVISCVYGKCIHASKCIHLCVLSASVDGRAHKSRFVYASVARLAVLKFVNYMNASADVLALASIEVPVDGIPDGGCVVVKCVPFARALHVYMCYVCATESYRDSFRSPTKERYLSRWGDGGGECAGVKVGRLGYCTSDASIAAACALRRAAVAEIGRWSASRVDCSRSGRKRGGLTDFFHERGRGGV